MVISKLVEELAEQEPDNTSDVSERIDWANLSPDDKSVFFGWLDEFFAVYLERGPGRFLATNPTRPTLPERKTTTAAAPVTKAHFGANVAAIQAQHRPGLPGHAESAPPLPGNRPSIPMVSKPVPSLAPPPVDEDGCLYCRDFSAVDAHAAQFPREHITSVQILARDLTDPFPSVTDKARAIFTWCKYIMRTSLSTIAYIS
jgi:hypothetical protein